MNTDDYEFYKDSFDILDNDYSLWMKEKTNLLNNLQLLCSNCHSLKTKLDEKKFKSVKKILGKRKRKNGSFIYINNCKKVKIKKN